MLLIRNTRHGPIYKKKSTKKQIHLDVDTWCIIKKELQFNGKWMDLLVNEVAKSGSLFGEKKSEIPNLIYILMGIKDLAKKSVEENSE